MRTWRHSTYPAAFLLLLLAALLPLVASAAPIEVWHYTVVPADPPSPGAGWGTVTQLLTGSGCDGTSCGSSWRPRNDSYTILLENAGDRIGRAHGAGDGSPPYDATVVYRRQTCPADGAWASGTWHHNFQARSRLAQTSFRIVQNGGQTMYYVTLTQRWGSGYYQSFAHSDPCFSADPFPQVTPTPPAGGGTGPTPTPASPPPTGQVRVSVHVSVSGTPPSAGSTSGTGGGTYTPGSSVRATASYPSAWDSDPTWGGITYSGCGQGGSDWQVTFSAPESDCALTFTITFTGENPGDGGGGVCHPDGSSPEERRRPTYSLWTPSINGIALPESGTIPVFPPDVTLTFAQIPTNFSIWPGKGWENQYLTVIYSGTKTADMRWNYDEDTDHGEKRRLLTVKQPILGFTPPTPGRFFPLWSGHPNQPRIEFATTLSGLPAGLYQIVSRAVQTACNQHWNARTFSFQVEGDLPTLPPAPSANLFGWVRSPHAGANEPFLSTQDNLDPTRFAWAYGGIAEFYPDLALTIPAAPGYRVTTSITGWQFRGSPPLDSTPIDRALGYRQPIRLLWSKYPPPELHAPAVDAYRIPRVDVPVAIAVTVDYTYQVYDAAGLPIGPPLSGSIEGQFSVSLVYGQILDGGQ